MNIQQAHQVPQNMNINMSMLQNKHNFQANPETIAK